MSYWEIFYWDIFCTPVTLKTILVIKVKFFSRLEKKTLSSIYPHSKFDNRKQIINESLYGEKEDEEEGEASAAILRS